MTIVGVNQRQLGAFQAETEAEHTREHRSFRLDGRLLAVIEDIARGVEEGDAGLKSCALGALAAGESGARPAEISVRHHREIEVIEDEDECFNAMGEMLSEGFSFSEVSKVVQLGGGATHLLALERWCDLVRLKCNADVSPPIWRCSEPHKNRQRCRRAMAMMRGQPNGHTHVSVLHIVYGWPDPFVTSLTADARVLLTERLGREYAPLARYTDVVEERRQAMVRADAARHDSPDGVVALISRRSRLAWADRCISSGDALRAALADPPNKTSDESSAAYRERVLGPARAERDAFLTAVKIEANRMLTTASLAYQAAWLRS